jgi:hypothetical protein
VGGSWAPPRWPGAASGSVGATAHGRPRSSPPAAGHASIREISRKMRFCMLRMFVHVAPHVALYGYMVLVASHVALYGYIAYGVLYGYVAHAASHIFV